jgi:soluble lytic murein transglycosylase-like protein
MLDRARLRVTFACCLAAATPAHAEVWGYIDEHGRPHVATEKLDERYQLFFKGPTTAEIEASRRRNERAPDVQALAQSPIYQRLTNHPNVRRYEPLIARYAKVHEVDPALVKAIVAVESAYEPAAVSPKGALGLMQVMPATGARYGIAARATRTIEQQLVDPETNVRIGTRYLRDLLRLFDNDLTLALAAYNAGEGAVMRYDNRVPPFPETVEYVKLVTQLYALYQPPPAPPPAGRVTIPRRRGEVADPAR